MYDVVIIGAGASGSICGAMLKKENPSLNVLILEKNDKLGKKLSITGNGRCNLGNLNKDISNYFSSSNLDKFEDELKESKYLEFIKSVGILIKEDSKRLYPYSNQALSVCKSLERYLNYLNVEIKYNYDVLNVKKENDIFIINDEIKSRKVIVATGGLTYPKTGSTGIGYEILKSFGHKITPLFPSLTYLKTDHKYIKELAGVRFDGIVSLCVDNKVVDEEQGQIQFTKDSLSGICVFNLSRNVQKYLNEKRRVKLILNLTPEYSDTELDNYLNSFSKYNVEDALAGILNNKLAYVLTKDLKIHGKKVSELTKYQFDDVLNSLHEFNFNIIGVGDIVSAQVTSGGASLDDFTLGLESLKYSGLYAVGEVLDVDGKCGGYNLSWAFTSAIIASNDILKNNL